MHEKSFKIDNIKFLWRKPTEFEQYELEMGLGFGYMGIPGNRQKAFLKEMGWHHEDFNGTFPHYYNDDMEEVTIGSDHMCINADTQIVFMNHIFRSGRGIATEYVNNDPYWIFHDTRHAKWDVYGNQVDGITSTTEFCRLIEGAELAKRYKVSMEVKTLIDLEGAWYNRFQTNNFQTSELLRLMPSRKRDHYDFCSEFGYVSETEFGDINRFQYY